MATRVSPTGRGRFKPWAVSTIDLFDPYFLRVDEDLSYFSAVMAMTSSEGETAMNRHPDHEDLIQLGVASEATKGGPWGVDDYRGSLMLGDVGLTQD